MNLCGSNFSNSILENCDFNQTNLDGANFDGANLIDMEFEEYPALKGHTDDVISTSFSPDGTKIVSASVDKTIRIWNSSTGK